MANKFKYTSFVRDAIKRIDKGKVAKLRKAGSYMKRRLRKKLNKKQQGGDASAPGDSPGKRSGTLRKGVASFIDARNATAFIGTRAPAHHAHLLEFGTQARYQKRTGRYTGVQAPRPFFLPTFMEEEEEVIKIMRETWA